MIFTVVVADKYTSVSSAVIVIVAVPTPLIVTIPSSDTVATFSLLLTYAKSVSASASRSKGLAPYDRVYSSSGTYISCSTKTA